MRRSKLEMHMEILKRLEQRGPLKLTQIMHKANVNCSTLKKQLDFLVAQGLVEKRIVERKVVYATTQHVVTVLEYYKKLVQGFPFMEETRNTAGNEITGPIISWSTA